MSSPGVTPLVIREAECLSDLLEIVKEVRGLWSSDPTAAELLWFRGVDDSSHSLLPKLYRPNCKKHGYQEWGIFNEFQRVGCSLISPAPQDHATWQWYVLAQHHGLPTRLLDWTESLTVALFFAIHKQVLKCRKSLVDTAAFSTPPTLTFPVDAAIWMMDAGSLNKVSTGDDNPIYPSEKEDSETATYLPGNLAMGEAAPPLAIQPPQVGTRIAAQIGRFTVHGGDERGIELFAESNPDVRLAKLVLKGNRLAQLWRELELLGVTQASLFPDLDNLVHQICWDYSQD